MADKKNGLSGPLKAFALASTISVQFAASILAGWWLGRLLDRKLHTEPWLMLVGLLTGIVAGMVGVYHTVAHVFNNRSQPKDGP